MQPPLSRSISPLPAAAIARIAAGETIESPAAAVRELVENALDAGATRLDLALNLATGSVRLADNGGGMDRDNLERAALPHTTSKIRDRDDLDRVGTLGFRGEALYSLAQLATLHIASRPPGDGATGWHATYDRNGRPDRVVPTPLAPGTVVTVLDLFAIWPARQSGLPSLAEQYRDVRTAVWQAALCHPHASWQLTRDDRPWFAISPSESVVGLLCQGIREARSGDFQEMRREVPGPEALDRPDRATLAIAIALPDRLHRHRPDWLHIAVNGRIVNAPTLTRAAIDAFGQTLPRHRHPVAFIHLHLPPGWIDWNRTPAKTDIYLRHADHWATQVRHAIEQTLRLQPPAPAAGLYGTPRTRSLVRAAEAAGRYSAGRPSDRILSDSLPLNPNDPLDAAGTDAPLPTGLKAIAQVRNTYIVAESPDGIWLVEQHVASERVHFEALRDRWQLVPLDAPIVLDRLSDRDRDRLAALGIDLEPFGEGLWAARAIPAPLRDRRDRDDALRELARSGDLETAQIAVACRTAIRNGQPLDPVAQQTLLDRWQRTRAPRTCPHGRPIYLPLDETALARFFRRHWVIGKSHGI